MIPSMDHVMKALAGAAVIALIVQDKEWGPREWARATTSLRKGENWSTHYVAAEGSCPLCSERFAAADVANHTTCGRELDFCRRRGSGLTGLRGSRPMCRARTFPAGSRRAARSFMRSNAALASGD